MKTISKITIGLATAALLFVGCGDTATPTASETVKPTISEESLGLRKTNLYEETAETEGDATHYGKSAAGSGYKIKRAFQDAPPMIPHDVEGMLPIKITDNQCIACHDPAVAKDMGATPYPSSHMINFRPSGSYAIKGENTSDGTLKHISIKKVNKLVGARFNCSQCHAPQADAPAPKNNFEADYTSADGASRSSWSGAKLMEGIDTTK
jgi:cytochrome c-type protein NapB